MSRQNECWLYEDVLTIKQWEQLQSLNYVTSLGEFEEILGLVSLVNVVARQLLGC